MSGTDRLAAFQAQRQPPLELNPMLNGISRTSYQANAVESPSGSDTSKSSSFLAEVTSLQASLSQLSSNVQTISSLHSRALNAIPDSSDGQDQATNTTLDETITDTRTLINIIKGRLQNLSEETQALAKMGKLTKGDVDLRVNQLNLLQKKFLERIQEYQRVERDYNVKTRERVARQFKIVKPDATPEEINSALNGGDMQQIFTQAALDQPSNRYSSSRKAFGEVISRQNDIQRIERTLAELASLTQDVALLVNQQDFTITNVEETARDVEKNTKEGEEHTNRAVELARAIRRKKWWCFFICFLVVLAIALAVGLSIGLKNN